MQDTEILQWGAENIGRTIDRSLNQTHYLLKTGKLPAWKVGWLWVARRADLLNPAAPKSGGK